MCPHFTLECIILHRARDLIDSGLVALYKRLIYQAPITLEILTTEHLMCEVLSPNSPFKSSTILQMFEM